MGKRFGQGKLYQNGMLLYEGEFMNNDFVKGVLYQKGCVIYEGEFKDNQYHGFGTRYDILKSFTNVSI